MGLGRSLPAQAWLEAREARWCYLSEMTRGAEMNSAWAQEGLSGVGGANLARTLKGLGTEWQGAYFKVFTICTWFALDDAEP